MIQIMDTPDTAHYLRINELKNHLYCPRIPFYALCLGIDRETGLSRTGIEAEADTKNKMKRRKQALHAIVEGTRHFDVQLASHQHRLVGKLDEIVETSQGVYLVDYKDTDHDHGYWRLQLCAYTLCAAESGIQPVLGSYVYSIPDQQYHLVKPTARDLVQLETVVTALWNTLETEICPPATPQAGKCRTCQYARFCNDVF